MTHSCKTKFVLLCFAVLFWINNISAFNHPLQNEENNCIKMANDICTVLGDITSNCLKTRFKFCMEFKLSLLAYMRNQHTTCQPEYRIVDICYFDESNTEVCVKVIYEGLLCA